MLPLAAALVFAFSASSGGVYITLEEPSELDGS
jgi:hypothetical protein